MKTRWLLSACLLLVALPPALGLGLWTRSQMMERARSDYALRLSGAVSAARRDVDATLLRLERNVRRVCESEPAIDRLALDRRLGRFTPEKQHELNEVIKPLARALELDVFDVAISEQANQVKTIASTHQSSAIGQVRARTTSATHVSREIVEALPSPTEKEVLVASCSIERLGTQLEVRGGVLLGPRLANLGADPSITVAIVERPPKPSATSAEIRSFANATGTPVKWLIARFDTDELSHTLSELDRALATALTISLAAALVLGLLLGRILTRPLAALEKAADQVAAGTLLPLTTDSVSQGGEVGRVFKAFNHMIGELERSRVKLGRVERVAAWREIARRMAHEIKNPLSPIQTSIETLRKTYARRHPDFDEIFEESTTAVLDAVKRLTHTVNEFSSFARVPRPILSDVSLPELFSGLVALHRGSDLELTTEITDNLPTIRADRSQLEQVLLNLVKNAREASPTHGRVHLSATRTSATGEVVIAVEDSGKGISSSDAAHIFDPYFTTKATGTGLGLSIVQRIVEEHAGHIAVEPGTLLGGAKFVIRLPIEGPKFMGAAESVM